MIPIPRDGRRAGGSERGVNNVAAAPRDDGRRATVSKKGYDNIAECLELLDFRDPNTILVVWGLRNCKEPGLQRLLDVLGTLGHVAQVVRVLHHQPNKDPVLADRAFVVMSNPSEAARALQYRLAILAQASLTDEIRMRLFAARATTTSL